MGSSSERYNREFQLEVIRRPRSPAAAKPCGGGGGGGRGQVRQATRALMTGAPRLFEWRGFSASVNPWEAQSR